MARRVARVAPNHLNTIVVPDPRPIPAPTVEAGVFAFDSAFVRPGVSIFLADLAPLVRSRDRRLTVFGHTDRVGSDQYNKELADRRAQALLSVITTDVELFEEIARAEAWGVAEHQAMLRTLGVDPGPPDGKPGPMTEVAVRAFQKGYNLRLWFESFQKPRHGQLEVTSDLDDPTRAALRDAYVNYIGLALKPGNFAQTTFAGCGEFNPRSPDAAENRRVTLALFEADGPSEPFPCVTGDASACQIDGEGTRTCRFYRTQVDEPEQPADLPVFFDDHWMMTPKRHAYLSVVTSLPDDTPVKFTVYRTNRTIPATALDSDTDEEPEDLQEVTSVDGTVSHGIAWAVWQPADDFTPFDSYTWFDDDGLRRTDNEILNGIPTEQAEGIIREYLEHSSYRPPVYKVEGDGKWWISRPPGRRLSGLVFSTPKMPDALVMTPDGRWWRTPGGDHAFGRRDTITSVVLDRALSNDEGDDA